MKFIHAIVFNKDEFENCNYDTGNWDDLCDGDYVVHCLYSVDEEEILIHEDNTHAHVEQMIDSYLDGVAFAHSTNVGGLRVLNEDMDVIKAFVIVDGCPYDEKVVKEKLVMGNYGEVL